MKYIILTISLLISAFSYAEDFTLSIESSGTLSWSNSVSNAVYNIEWASELGKEWRSDNPFERIHSSSNHIVVPIPMYFRVVARDANQIQCWDNLDKLDKAIDQWALETATQIGSTIDTNEVIWYIHPDNRDTVFICPSGGEYDLGMVGDEPTCSIHGISETQ